MPEDAQLANIYRVETAQPWQHYKLHRNEIYKKAQHAGLVVRPMLPRQSPCFARQWLEAKGRWELSILVHWPRCSTQLLTHSVTHSHVACLVGLHLRLRPASNARIGMTSGGVAFNLQVVQVALLFDWRWNPTSERLSILCQTTFLSWKLPNNGTGVETLDFVRTIVVDSGV